MQSIIEEKRPMNFQGSLLLGGKESIQPHFFDRKTPMGISGKISIEDNKLNSSYSSKNIKVTEHHHAGGEFSTPQRVYGTGGDVMNTVKHYYDTNIGSRSYHSERRDFHERIRTDNYRPRPQMNFIPKITGMDSSDVLVVKNVTKEYETMLVENERLANERRVLEEEVAVLSAKRNELFRSTECKRREYERVNEEWSKSKDKDIKKDLEEMLDNKKEHYRDLKISDLIKECEEMCRKDLYREKRKLQDPKSRIYTELIKTLEKMYQEESNPYEENNQLRKDCINNKIDKQRVIDEKLKIIYSTIDIEKNMKADDVVAGKNYSSNEAVSMSHDSKKFVGTDGKNYMNVDVKGSLVFNN